MKFRIIDKKKREKKNLEGIVPLLRNRGQSNIIEIKNWRNWKYSFWARVTLPESSHQSGYVLHRLFDYRFR